jgi:sugar phosphate isomerase/epimerase
MAGRTVKLELGVNGAFCTRRWEEPENWMRLTREIGFRNHEFCGDVVDPFFSGDRAFQLDQAAQVKAAAAKYGVHITDIYTGVATHRFHGLSHSHPSPRARMREWIVDVMDLARAMGTDRIGGHWDAFSIEVLEDERRTREAFTRICDEFRELARIGKDKGMAAIYQEQMYIPSEVPWTLQQCEDFLIGANRGQPGVPVYVTVDVGHQAGMHYGLTGDDLSYLAWTRRFAACSEIIHLQQTTPDASHHWPFAEEYNQRGRIDIPAFLDAVEQSHREYENNPVSEHLPPVERTFLIAEIIPGSTKTEEKLLAELTESAEYLKQFVPEDGLELTV